MIEIEYTIKGYIQHEDLFDGLETEIEFDVVVNEDQEVELVEGSLSVDYKNLSNSQYKILRHLVNRIIDDKLDHILDKFLWDLHECGDEEKETENYN